jgi:uncharacterized protein (TIGR03435 family)
MIPLRLIQLRLRTPLLIVALMFALPHARALQMPGFPTLSDTDAAPADPNAKLPQFEVASIRQNKSGGRSMSWKATADGFTCTNASLKLLVANAYGIRYDLISGGPGWVETTGFDIQAKVAGEDVAAYKKLTQKQRDTVLQALLVDRFQLKVENVTKVLPMYDLIVAKGGPTLKTSPPVTPEAEDEGKKTKPRGVFTFGPGNFKGQYLDLGTFAANLSDVLESTVADKTGMKGQYDIDLKWTPEDEKGSGTDNGADADLSIFTAVQEQLGLKLQPTKGPTDTLVIEHAEMPSQN